MGRRKIVVGVILGCLAGPGLWAAETRPNFIFILTDDQRWDILGCVQQEQGERARFPWLKTPNMDRIAREGARLRNAFVVNSLCAPSRATFLTGQYGHVNGVVNNHTPFPESNITHASLLKKAGYVTGYFGKWHQDGQKERPGFDVVASFIGQGKYADCPMSINGNLTPTKGWVDDVTTDYAIRFIRENKDKPFVMVVGYKSPHGPRTPPERAARRFEGEALRPVPNLQIAAPYRGETAPAAGGAKKNKAGSQAREGLLDYFRCVSAADDCIGKVLDALDELKLAENTVVVFAGDNGYYLGEHQLGDKRSAYEESLRIPLLVRYPRGIPAGATIDAMVLNIDLAPTLLDYAGQPIPSTMHGRSFKPLLENKVADWRTAWFYCYFFEKGFAGTPLTTAVRTATHKLIKYPGHENWTELFDLTKDPYEVKNLAKQPECKELLANLQAEYDKQAQAIGFKVPDFADKPAAK